MRNYLALIALLLTSFGLSAANPALSVSFAESKQKSAYDTKNFYEADKPIRMPFYLLNEGDEVLTSATIVYSIDGGTEKESTSNFGTTGLELAYDDDEMVYFTLDPITTEGAHTIKLRLTKANGQANQSTDEDYLLKEFSFNIVKAPELPAGVKEFTFVQKAAPVKYQGLPGQRTYTVCMVLDTIKNSPVRGKQIVGAKVTNLCTNGTTNYRLWYSKCNIRTRLPDYCGLKDEVFVEPVGDSISAPFALTQAFDATAPYAIGYKFDITNPNDQNKTPVAYSECDPKQPYSFLQNKKGRHDELASNFGNYSTTGAAMITVYYTDDFDDRNSSLDVVEVTKDHPFAAEETITLPIRFYNSGEGTVKSMAFTAEIPGKIKAHGPISNLSLGSRMMTILNFTVAPLPVGEYPLTFTVDSVNGKPNTSNKKTLNYTLKIVDFLAELPEGYKTLQYADFKEGKWLSANTSTSKHAEVAMLVREPSLKNVKIVGMDNRFIASNPDALGIKNFEYWTSSALTTGAPDGQKVAANVSNNRAVGIFTTPVPVPEEGLYVGYSYDASTAAGIWYGIGYSTPLGRENSFFYRLRNNASWYNGSEEYGCATITVYIQGETPEGIKVTKAIGNPASMPGETFPIELEVYNYSGIPVNEISYNFSGTGVNGEKTLTLPQPLSKIIGLKSVVKLPEVEAPASGSSAQMTVGISKVNGKTNSIAENSKEIRVNLATFRPVNRPILEEGTGTQCGWCPRGMVALREMGKRYPEFVSAAYHTYTNYDPMYFSGKLPWDNGSYPCASINRGTDLDPFYGTHDGVSLGVEQDYKEMRALVAPAALDLETSWNADKTVLNVSSNVKFAYVEPGQTYKMGYIVTIDSLKHYPGSMGAWKQSNAYTPTSSFAADPLLVGICNGTDDVHRFDHVVVEASNYLGIDGSLPATLEVNKVYNHACELSLKDNDITSGEDLSKVKVIAVLLDSTGAIRNSNVAVAGKPSATGIETLEADNADAAVYYDLMGRMVAHPQNGIFVKVQNGQATKIRL